MQLRTDGEQVKAKQYDFVVIINTIERVKTLKAEK